MKTIKNDLIKYTPRKEQTDVLNFVKENVKNNKFFLLDLPPGVGKSHVSLMLSDFFISTKKCDKVDMITAGKILQNQYSQTYESINDLKGKENYDCTEFDCSCASGKEFSKLNKSECASCPYENSKIAFIDGQVSLTNFHLYLIYALYDKVVLNKRGSKLLIIDECHLIDDVICGFISVKITENNIKKLTFANEQEIIKELRSVKDIKDYVDFLKYFEQQAGINATTLNREVESTNTSDASIKKIQTLVDLNQVRQKITLFLKEYEDAPNNFVLETNYNEKTKQNELSLEPIWAAKYLEKYVWSKYDYVVLMSGTILDKKIFSSLNGIPDDKSVYFSIPSPFPVKNRPIYYLPVGKMTFNEKNNTFQKYRSVLDKILKKYHDKKGIIHTNSFELSTWINEGIDNERLMFHDSNNRDEMLRTHMETAFPSVFVSPSVSTGVSFDHDKSRFQVIAKIPYPSLASQKNKLRQETNPDWYRMVTCQVLIQCCGRSVRSKTDYADTLILDESFSDILGRSSHFLPGWFIESIKMIKK